MTPGSNSFNTLSTLDIDGREYLYYSLDKLVVHVAAHPPSSRMRGYATTHGRRIVHIPLGSLSPVSLRI